MGLFGRRFYCSLCGKRRSKKRFHHCDRCMEQYRIDKLENQCKTEGCDNRKDHALTDRCDWGYCRTCYRNLEKSFVGRVFPNEKQYEIENLVEKYYPSSSIRFVLNSSTFLLNDPSNFDSDQINALIEPTGEDGRVAISHRGEGEIIRIHSALSKTLGEIEEELEEYQVVWQQKISRMRKNIMIHEHQERGGYCSRCHLEFSTLEQSRYVPSWRVCETCNRADDG